MIGFFTKYLFCFEWICCKCKAIVLHRLPFWRLAKYQLFIFPLFLWIFAFVNAELCKQCRYIDCPNLYRHWNVPICFELMVKLLKDLSRCWCVLLWVSTVKMWMQPLRHTTWCQSEYLLMHHPLYSALLHHDPSYQGTCDLSFLQIVVTGCVMQLYTAHFYYKLEKTDFSMCLIITSHALQFIKMYSLTHFTPL